MAEYDGSINIKTSLDNNTFLAGTKEIKEAIQSLQQSVEDSGNRLNDTLTRAIENINSGITVTSETISNASESMNDLGESAQQAADGVQHMEQAAENIERVSENIGRASQNTEELRNDLEEVVQTISEISTAEINIPSRAMEGDMFSSVGSSETNRVNETSRAFDELTRKVQRYRDAIEAQGRGGEEFESLVSEIKRVEQEIDKVTDQIEQMERAGIDQTNEGQYERLLSTLSQLKHEFGQLSAVKEQSMKAPDLSSWNNAATISNTLKQAFDKIRNSAQVALYGWQHPLGLIDRAMGSAAGAVSNFGKVAISSFGKAAGSVLNFTKSLAKSAINKAVEGLKSLGNQALNAVKSLAKMAGSGALTFLKKLADGAKNAAIQLAKIAGNAVSSGIRKIGDAAMNGAKSLLHLGRNAQASSGGLQVGLKSLMRYGLGVRSVFALINRLRSAFVSAFQNMAQNVPSVNRALSSLSSSLAMLKASLATAFQPIVTTVAPYLAQFMDMLSQALTKVGMFFAALTGQKFVFKAEKPKIDYAAENQSSAQKKQQQEEEKRLKEQQKAELERQKEEIKAQNEAEKERVAAEKAALKDEKARRKEMAKTTKEAENQLAAFDNLNILQDTSKDDTDIDTSDLDDALDNIKANLEDMPTLADLFPSGSGGASDYFSPDVSFEKIPVESAIADFAKRIKDAFEKGDFYNIGKQLADKVNSWFEGIDWPGLGQKVAKGINSIVDLYNGFMDNIKWEDIGKDLAAFLNKLIEDVDWKELGRALTQHIDALFKTLLGFVKDFNFEDAGKAFAELLQGMFEGIDWDTVGTTLGLLFTGLAKFVYEAAINFPWEEVGKKLASGMNKFVDNLDTKLIADALIALIDGALDGMKSFIENFDWKDLGEKLRIGILEFVNKFPADEAAEVLTGFVKGLIDVILPTISDPAFWTGLADKFAAFVNGVFTDKSMWDKLEKLVENLINGLLAAIKRFFNKFDSETVGKILASKFKELVKNINADDVADALTGAIKALLNLITPTLTDETTWKTIGSKLAKVLNKLFTDKEMWTKLRNAFVGAIKGAITALTTFVEKFKWGESGKMFHDQILKLVEEFPLNELGVMLAELLKGAFTWFNNVFGDETIMKELGGKLGTFLTTAFQDEELWKTVGEALATALGNVLSLLEGLGEKFKPEAAANAIKTLLGQVPWDDIASRAWELLKGALAGAGSFVDALFSEGVSDGVKSKADSSAYWSAAKDNAEKSVREFNAQSIGSKIGARISEAINAIPWKEFGTAISTAATNLFNNFADAMKAAGKTDKDGQTALSKAVIDFFTGIDWGQVAQALLRAAWETFVTLGKSLFGLVISGFTGEDPEGYLEENNGFGDALAGMAHNTASDPTMLDAYDSVGETAANETVSSYSDTIGAGRKDIQDATDSAFELQDSSHYESEGKKPADGIVDGALKYIEKKKPTFNKGANDALKVTWNESELTKQGEKPAKSVIDGIKSGFEKNAPSAEKTSKSTFKGIVKAGEDEVNNVDWKGLGAKPPEDTADGADSKRSYAERTLTSVFNDIVKGAEDIVKDKDFKEKGQEMPEDFSDGVERTAWAAERTVETSFKDIADSGADAIEDKDWNGVGENIVKGVEKGANEKKGSLFDGLKDLASNALKAAKSALGIHSPSSVFRDQVGLMIGAGLAEGIDKSTNTVLSSVAGIAQSMVDEMDDTELDPEITASGDMLVNGLDDVLTSFSDKVQYSFVTLLDRLQAISDNVTFRAPNIAMGTVLPYAVQGTYGVDTGKISDTITANNEELIHAMIQCANNQTTAIVRAIEQYARSGGTLDLRAIADRTIKEINTRTRATGKSPIII